MYIIWFCRHITWLLLSLSSCCLFLLEGITCYKNWTTVPSKNVTIHCCGALLVLIMSHYKPGRKEHPGKMPTNSSKRQSAYNTMTEPLQQNRYIKEPHNTLTNVRRCLSLPIIFWQEAHCFIHFPGHSSLVKLLKVSFRVILKLPHILKQHVRESQTNAWPDQIWLYQDISCLAAPSFHIFLVDASLPQPPHVIDHL